MSDLKHNPFAGLGQKLGVEPKAAPAPEPPKAPEKKGPARAVVRMEKKGRGGKEVTVIEKLELPPKALEEWLKALKQALGTGGAVEEGAIVLQGDHRQRLVDVLEKRGVKKVTLG
ncbi:MAG: translation initiation factor [Myxococcota bacterium]